MTSTCRYVHPFSAYVGVKNLESWPNNWSQPSSTSAEEVKDVSVPASLEIMPIHVFPHVVNQIYTLLRQVNCVDPVPD